MSAAPPPDAPRTLRLADWLGLRVVRQPRLSPDGRRVVCAVTEVDPVRDGYRSHLWLLEEGGARALTRGTVSDGGARWSPDGRRLAFVSEREGTPGIWLLDLAGGEPRRLWSSETLRPSALAWSPDGTRLAFLGTPKPPKPEKERRTGEGELLYRRIRRPRYRLDGAGWLAEERSQVYVLPVTEATENERPEPRRRTDGPADAGAPSWSPDGREIAFATTPAETADEADLAANVSCLFAVAAEGDAAPRRVSRNPGGWIEPVWSPDGRWILALGHPDERDTWGTANSELRLFPAGGGAGVPLTASLDRPAEDLSADDLRDVGGTAHQFVDDGKAVLFPLSNRGAVELWRVPVPAAGEAAGPPEPVARGPRVHGEAHAAGGRVATLVADPVRPPEVFVGTLPSPGETLDLRPWSGFNDAWRRSVTLGEAREFETRAADGHPVHGWVLPGRSASGRPPAAVLEIHGGPHVQYAWSFMFEFHFLNALGFTVLYVNPRGSQGYGDAHARAIHHDFAGPAARDLEAATDWAVEAGLADPERLGVTGGSGGGYLTSWLVGHTDRFRAACSQRALNDWRTFYGNSDMGWASDWQIGGVPWTHRADYLRQSPLPHAHDCRTPLLVVHSEEDWRCNVSEAEQLFTWLRYQGRPVEMLRFPGESHGLSRGGTPSRRLERLRAIGEWFRRHLIAESHAEPSPAGHATGAPR